MHSLPTLCTGAVLVAAVASTSCWGSPDASTPPDAEIVHEQAIVLDAHAHPNAAGSGSVAPDGSEWSIEMDLGPMEQGRQDAVFFSVPLLVEEGEEQPDSARVLAGIRTIIKEVGRVEDRAEIALSAADVLRIQALGKRAILLGNEGWRGGDLGIFERYHAAGIRMITLALDPGEASRAEQVDTDDPPLGPYGRAVVEEMNRLGIIIDITHSSDRQQMEIINASTMPVVASHSNARALHDVPREIPDTIIGAIAEKGGVICVTFHPSHMADSPSETPVTVENLVDHIDHLVGIAGMDHVGFGSDFIAGGTETVGLESAADLPNITSTLLERGYAPEDIHKILGGNLLRVLGEVGAVGTVEGG